MMPRRSGSRPRVSREKVDSARALSPLAFLVLRCGDLLVALGLLLGLVLTGCTQYGATLNRPGDPVVLNGSSVPKLLGSAPAHLVGFSWDGGAWHQIPVQVDQRDWVSPGQILGEPANAWPRLSDGSLYKILIYTTPSWTAPGYTYWNTYTGNSSSSTLAATDEISFLGDDAGQQAPGSSAPPGVDASNAQQVLVSDPLHPGQTGYVYLYPSATLTGGAAGTTGVSYDFSLDSGDYKSTYRMGTHASAPNNVAGFNPEHSTVKTPAYQQTYGDRWLNNGLTISAGGASGAPLLERARVQVPTWGCARSEDTFDGSVTNPYEGAFITNISGPVRAIRSYMGANSGTYTASTDIFYPQREDSTSDLRVHPIPGVTAFDDFVTGTPGLSYSDDQNSGVPIDGKPDVISTSHAPAWQMVSGPPGSLVTTRAIATNISGLAASTYYLDQSPAMPPPCTGDQAAWGQSGVTVTGPGGAGLPCTDPGICAGAATLATNRYRYFERPGLSSADAAALAARATTPLQATVTSPGQASSAGSEARTRPPPAPGGQISFAPSFTTRELQASDKISLMRPEGRSAVSSADHRGLIRIGSLTVSAGAHSVTLRNLMIVGDSRGLSVVIGTRRNGPLRVARLAQVHRSRRAHRHQLTATLVLTADGAHLLSRAVGARALTMGVLLGQLTLSYSGA